jgi:hypothetical protein
MTTRTMGEWMRAAILEAGVCLIPAAALAEDSTVPDHAEAQAGTGAELRVPTAEKTEGAPDHEQAQARGASPDDVRTPVGPTDHATVQSRGAAITK